MLIRRSPDSPGAEAVVNRANAWVRDGRAGLLFFHGAGVTWAHALPAAQAARWLDAGLDLMLCSAAWARRSTQAPPTGWHTGSLIQFWDAAERAETLASLGMLEHV